ncbi:MAG TPA: hypothetical protein VFX49_08570, partial [Chloroflexota bacterium]|nr:hypothetical protein [Chloroflexota bacterium]
MLRAGVPGGVPEALLALAAPVPPDHIVPQLAGICRLAVDVLRARDARLVLEADSDWRDLLPADGPAHRPSHQMEDASPDGVAASDQAGGRIWVDRDGRLEWSWEEVPVVERALRGGEVVIDTRRGGGRDAPWPVAAETVAVAPLRLQGSPLGALVVGFEEPDRPTAEGRDGLAALVPHAAEALRTARLLLSAEGRAQRAERLAQTLAEVGAQT